MKILIATGDFYPFRDANAICVRHVAINLIEMGHEVTVLCYRQDGIDVPSEIDGISLETVSPDIAVRMLAYSKRFHSIRAFVARILGSAIRKVERVACLPWSPMTAPLFCFQYYKILSSIHKRIHSDLIVSVFLPFEPSVAAYWLNKSDDNIKWCLYALDNFENERVPHAIREFCIGKRWIEQFLDYSNRFLIMKSRLGWFSEHGFKNRLQDITITDIPLFEFNALSRLRESGHISISSESTWVYAGSFSPPYYRHDDLFFIFLNLYRDGEAKVLKIYTDSSSQEALSGPISITNGAIVCCDTVPHEELKGVLQAADILVSVKYRPEISAKIFDYFATGQPVFHVSGCSDDPCAEYVEAYPFGCVVYPYREGTAEMIEKVRLWLAADCGRHACQTDAAEAKINDVFLMNNPKYTCRLMLDSAKV